MLRKQLKQKIEDEEKVRVCARAYGENGVWVCGRVFRAPFFSFFFG